jgi:hypothetical protein
MRERSAWWLAAGLLWPLLCRADVDLPELGVRLGSLPEGAAPPQVSAEPGGYQAVTHAGVASLSIFREDQPAPAGSDVADPQYRATLDQKYKSIESKDQGAPTALAEHSAWTVVDMQHASGTTHYTCLTYVIVDQHLYRLVVTADSTQGRPAEFDSLVVAMSGVKFEPVQRAPQAAASRSKHG